ncbi:hypothetical protein BC833DRAFT_580484 [Globomyces pollinis-pini]|nr:hypothetical protein BC833DRAFT_580484 [Globomyces pollinis-pini]
MQVPTELEQSIAKANQAVEKAQSDYDNKLASVSYLDDEYTKDFIQKNPNATAVEIDQYLKKALKIDYESLARKRQKLALEKQIVELLKQQTTKLQRDVNRGISSPITAGTAKNMVSNSQFVQTTGDEYLIRTNSLDLQKPCDTLKYLLYRLEKAIVKLPNPNSVELMFQDDCLEYRLDRRITRYNLDDIDNVKLILGVSGAGKTRMLLELLYANFGYYFTTTGFQRDFGSADLNECQSYCDYYPSKVKHAIHLLYFVRAAICKYLMDKGFEKPGILLAQLHPVAFFGVDIFEIVFKALWEKGVSVEIGIINPYPLIVIDHIQRCVRSAALYQIPGSTSKRPFFSPLVHYSNMMQCYPHFLLAGTGINFEYVKEALESGTMKNVQMANYEVVSYFHPLSRKDIEVYAYQFLQEHEIQEVDYVVSRISAFDLCHGRPQFVAYILEVYMESKDIDFAIGKFVSGISIIHGHNFPLRLFKRDIENNVRSLERVIAGDTLGTIIRDGILELILTGELRFSVANDDENCVAAIQYGLGFCEVSGGIVQNIVIQEQAIVECLRYFIPFADIVMSFAKNIAKYPKPQMVGYLVEYLVAFALVSNYSGPDAAKNIKASNGFVFQHLRRNDSSQVCFPDPMCGPDIIYKCMKTKTVYLVQVKFVKGISKQEAVNACDTTDPDRFYCKRKGNGVLKGNEQLRSRWCESLTELQRDGYSLQQMLVTHTGGNQTVFTQDAQVVTKSSDPEFFHMLPSGIWDFLDNV